MLDTLMSEILTAARKVGLDLSQTGAVASRLPTFVPAARDYAKQS